jgi:hypothetical protein
MKKSLGVLLGEILAPSIDRLGQRIGEAIVNALRDTAVTSKPDPAAQSEFDALLSGVRKPRDLHSAGDACETGRPIDCHDLGN